jgi:hypothetical protein
MARGWESKSVEAQQMEASAEKPASLRKQLSPEEAASARRKAVLVLSRKHVAKQLEIATNPRQRNMLETALADLDRQIRESE